ncbi:DinB family protein [Bacillus sp. B-jedd]|uniref:DinB family protein n=1 Tax=Bacillus sp. B-jedd TaxID=1476857 RepID=UPI0005155D34|nr:DinB family protein [Bacillus sp. B-jedd]CEG27034.1 Hypothetical protein BN1002_01890 [Bacillus sp. B-jedd]
MTQVKDVLLEQLAATYDTSGWFTSLEDALKGVTYEQAVWTPGDDSNSIWAMVQHLAHWSEVYLEKYKPGSVGEITSIENQMTFEIEEEKTEENWEKSVERLKKAYAGWRTALEENPEKLDEEDWGKRAAHYILHNAYHIGQIVTLRKLQGSWTPSNL